MSQTQSMPRAAAALPPPIRPSAHRLVWSRIRRFFPSHAQALQTPAGALEVTWSLPGERGSRYATPILVRLEPGWVDDLEEADDWGRDVMVAKAAETVRLGLFGYEPDTALPQARVIVVG